MTIAGNSPPLNVPDDVAEATELVYRKAIFSEDRYTLKMCLSCFFLLNIFLWLTERIVIGSEPYFDRVVGLRFMIAVLMILYWGWLHRLKSVASLEALKAVCVISLCAATALINLQYGSPALLDILLILVVYTILPGSRWVAILGTSVLSVVTIYLMVPLTDDPYNVDLLAGNVLSHTLGLMLGTTQRNRRRELFWAATRDRELRVSLETALSEVKRLSGLLPICCVCKKIRNEDGAWIRLEAYLQENSEANFSHGYCPCCYDVAVNED